MADAAIKAAAMECWRRTKLDARVWRYFAIFGQPSLLLPNKLRRDLPRLASKSVEDTMVGNCMVLGV